ncbi:MAG: isoleucine--tRNA ligase [Chloroflexi bacterium]|nr:isoleucine--tRNA ligase [Chloroflexota bacterium]
MFKEVDSKVDFPTLENSILQWWNSNSIPDKYMNRNNESSKKYSFIDGPITANNPMGVHHAWGRGYKDLFSRFRTMQGYRQRYQNGFDGQGLWIEVEVEKELGFSSKTDIEKFGIGKFVNLCKERVQKFSDIITDQSKRLGYWMDWDNSYHTMSDENNYTIWNFLKVCHERGLLYEGRDVMPWCPRCSTGLSEHEIVTEGYVEIVHPGLFVKFPIYDKDNSETTINESILIWTTTPWTLTSNCAAAVNPEMDYVKVKQGKEFYYLSKQRISSLIGDYEIIDEMKGTNLVGLKYKAPFDELPVQKDVTHRIVSWDEVSEEEGTGIVHIAPGAGKEDFALGKEENLSVIAPLDDLGNFIDGFDWLTGLNVYSVNDLIYKNLKEKNVFYRLDQYKHRYPHCWRCGSELVFRLVDEWFIRMDPLREDLSRVTQEINWVPEFGMKRELDWIRNMDDWMISKKRYYGLALPIYKCSCCDHFEVMGSEDELKQKAVEGWNEFEGNSPHRPWIDSVKIACSECDNSMSRIIDVGNPWLDAGIVSFSTLNYRNNKDYWNDWFPADWISESFPGQYRNWFYSLLVMSTVLADSAPCKNIFSYALMRDQNGDEMHKSKGNAIWFEDAADKMGVDAMRWQFSRQNPALNLNFGFETADEVRRQFLIPLWNVYSFFVTYANIDEFDPNITFPELDKRSELDRWIISELHSLIASVTESLENFEPEKMTRDVEEFMGFLSNWYVRRSRRRFWKSGSLQDTDIDVDKLSAYATLYEVLLDLTKLLAPVIPFVTESIYQNLTSSLSDRKESVHLETYPEADTSVLDQDLSYRTRLAMKLSSMGRAARSKSGIKVRQPLEHLYVHTRNSIETDMLPLISEQILDELNVKNITPVSDASDIVSFKIQPNLPLLGPKYGKDINKIKTILSEMDPLEVRKMVESGENIALDEFILNVEDILISATELEGVSSVVDSGYAVAISSEISEDLKDEGFARELVHHIQNMRKEAGFEISDHIDLWIYDSESIKYAINKHHDYICLETLAKKINDKISPDDSYGGKYEIEGHSLHISIRKL